MEGWRGHPNFLQPSINPDFILVLQQLDKMATDTDAEAPHNHFDVCKFPSFSLLVYPSSTNSPHPCLPTSYTRAGLIRFVTDHPGVGFWQPNLASHPPTLAGSQCVR